MIFAAIADWADRKEYKIDFMCAQLGVSESGFYAWRNRVPSAREQDNARLLVIIRDAYARLRGNPGVRRIHAELIALGLQVGGLAGAGWAVSLAMAGYFGWYFWRLMTWTVNDDGTP